jgi:signal transduction histidine kinase
MAKPTSIALRLISAAAVWVAVMLIAGGLLLSNLFREPLEKSFDQRLGFLLESLIAAVELAPNGTASQRQPLGEPRFLRQYSGWYWQVARIEDRVSLIRSRSMWDFEIPVNAAPSAAGSYAMDGPLGARLRVLERRITQDGVPGTYQFVVAADRKDLIAAIEAFDRTLLWSLGILGIGLLLSILLQVRYGLLPLKRIGMALSNIREGRAERLDGDFPAEVRPLADELNGLLDHTSGVLERARAHVGNLAHALKTPIAVLTNEGDQPGVDTPRVLREQAGLMRRQVDHYLARARAVGQAPLLRGTSRLEPVLGALARTLEKIHADRAVTIDISVTADLAFRGEQPDLEEMLGNLLDNACKWAGGRVTLNAEAVASPGAGGLQIRLLVDDDGPGIPLELRDEIFERGRRGDESRPGSGLGLSIVRDIATLYGGMVTLETSPLGGLRAVLVLPGAYLKSEDA